jgi:DNA-binding NarL/FixJ family response regulator
VPDPIRVVIVEDNDVFREALVLLLGQRPDIDVIADVAGGEEAVDVCRREQPDVVLLDYRLPGIDGVQTTAALRVVCSGTAVVCLTAAVTLREQEALRAEGVVAFLTKDAPLDEIVAALLDAAAARAT